MKSASKEITEGQKDSIKLVQDITKQLITLGSAILALSATFLKSIVGSYPLSIFLICISWILITISIIFGIITLASLVDKLKNNIYDPFATPTRTPAIIQWITFVIGITLFLIFVIVNLS